jgi:hypothetical protein
MVKKVTNHILSIYYLKNLKNLSSIIEGSMEIELTTSKFNAYVLTVRLNLSKYFHMHKLMCHRLILNIYLLI